MKRYRRSENPTVDRWSPTPDEWNSYISCDGKNTISDIAKRLGRPHDTIAAVLEHLADMGLLEPIDPLPPLKRRLRAALEQHLGPRATPYVQQIDACQSYDELADTARKLCLKLRLTVSQKAAKAIEEVMREG